MASAWLNHLKSASPINEIYFNGLAGSSVSNPSSASSAKPQSRLRPGLIRVAIAGNVSFRRFGSLADFTVTTKATGWRWFSRLQFSLKCLPKFVTGPSSPRQWKQLVPHQVRCTSAPKHWQKASSIQCPQASQKLLTAFLQPESSPTDQQPCHISRAVTPLLISNDQSSLVS